MTSRGDVYRKFGVASEAAQLLETELGNLLIEHQASSKGLITSWNRERAAEIVENVNRSTLGALLRTLTASEEVPSDLEAQLEHALHERNRLTHGFFREHNFRINSADGRSAMYQDLDGIHEVIFSAYKALLMVSQGIDLDREGEGSNPPSDHVPI